MKLATWNVMLPVAERRREALRAHCDREAADVWVLTEAHDGFDVGHPHVHTSAPGRDGAHGEQHHWVAIHSRFPLEPLPVSDEERSACALVQPDSEPTSGSRSSPFVVFGTVLPWVGSPWREHPAAGGVAFGEALALQLEDWRRLRRSHPDHEFFLLGDFNQDLAASHYYGSRRNRAALEAALAEVGLAAWTAMDNDPIRRDSPPLACIDHICARADSAWTPAATRRWPDAPAPEKWLTDHFGVAVDLRA